MSLNGQIDADPVWAIDTDDFTVAEGIEWGAHRHDNLNELLWATRGTLTVETERGWFAVPNAVGLWIPRGVEHRVVAAAHTSFRCTHLEPHIGSPADDVTAVAIPETVGALLSRLQVPPYLSQEVRTHAELLVPMLLEPVHVSTVDLPLPVDDRTLRIAQAILADPADDRELVDWGFAVGASARNLSRLFVAETGLTFTTWRTRARMRRAIELLAADHSVSAAAAKVGYASASAFVQAFRREIGHTPGAFASARARTT